MAYGDYLKTISTKFENLIAEISIGYNFDYGEEFEIALCKVFRVLLPSKFGICRGFVVTADGKQAGDDIIIFDHERFPTLRLLENQDFAQKQKIPAEAVYCYIEAKHSIPLDAAGSAVLEKALSQVSAVKLLERDRVSLNQITPTVKIQEGGLLKVPQKPWWPTYKNPLFTGIIARRFEFSSKASATTVLDLLKKAQAKPDLLILGKDYVGIPTHEHTIDSPFLVEGTDIEIANVPDSAFALGVSLICLALDEIQLGGIQWHRLIKDALQGVKE
jgi:hypothetical protein